MALVVITISDSADGSGVAVSLISEPAMNMAAAGATTPAQQTALAMLEAMKVEKDEPSRVLLLND